MGPSPSLYVAFELVGRCSQDVGTDLLASGARDGAVRIWDVRQPPPDAEDGRLLTSYSTFSSKPCADVWRLDQMNTVQNAHGDHIKKKSDNVRSSLPAHCC